MSWRIRVYSQVVCARCCFSVGQAHIKRVRTCNRREHVPSDDKFIYPKQLHVSTVSHDSLARPPHLLLDFDLSVAFPGSALRETPINLSPFSQVVGGGGGASGGSSGGNHVSGFRLNAHETGQYFESGAKSTIVVSPTAPYTLAIKSRSFR